MSTGQTTGVCSTDRGPPETAVPLSAFLLERGVLVAGRGGLRLATHLDVTADDVVRVVAAFDEYFRTCAGNGAALP